jgi:hypothetical protein
MRRKLVISGSFLVIMVAVLLLWPTAGYDISKVHSSLRQLATPYQSVSTGYYLDGGSIGITIVDREARKLELALPVSSEGGRRHPRLFIGATYASATSAVEVAYTADTRRMLITIVEEYRAPGSDTDITLVALRGAPRDYARLGGRAVANFCQSVFK